MLIKRAQSKQFVVVKESNAKESYLFNRAKNLILSNRNRQGHLFEKAVLFCKIRSLESINFSSPQSLAFFCDIKASLALR